MSTKMIFVAIIISAVCTFSLRALPFILFRGERRQPAWLDDLGKRLPCAIMAVLIVYCMKDVGSDFTGIGIPKIVAGIFVAITYKWRHNTLLSIFAGTICYMLMLHI